MLSIILVLGISSVWAQRECEGALNIPAFRKDLVLKGILNDPDARSATFREVLIIERRAGRISGWLRLPSREAKGVLVTTAAGEPMVFRQDPESSVFKLMTPSAYANVAVWDHDQRLLTVVEGTWRWEVRPAKGREVSDLSLLQFLTEFAAVLGPMLDDGEIAEDDLRDGVFQVTVKPASHVVFESPAREKRPARVFVFSRGSRPRWEKDFVQKIPRKTAVAVGARRRRLFQRVGVDGVATGEPAWAPPAGLRHAVRDKIEDASWRAFVDERPEALDDLMLHPLAPSVSGLTEAKMAEGTTAAGAAVRVLLTPRFGAGTTAFEPLPYTNDLGWWPPGALADGEVVELTDGRRFGATADRSGFRWLGRRDALERLIREISP